MWSFVSCFSKRLNTKHFFDSDTSFPPEMNFTWFGLVKILKCVSTPAVRLATPSDPPAHQDVKSKRYMRYLDIELNRRAKYTSFHLADYQNCYFGLPCIILEQTPWRMITHTCTRWMVASASSVCTSTSTSLLVTEDTHTIHYTTLQS